MVKTWPPCTLNQVDNTNIKCINAHTNTCLLALTTKIRTLINTLQTLRTAERNRSSKTSSTRTRWSKTWRSSSLSVAKATPSKVFRIRILNNLM
jgi:hypothetical protein